MEVSFGRIIVYTKNADKMCAFYEKFFGFKSRRLPNDRIVECRISLKVYHLDFLHSVPVDFPDGVPPDFLGWCTTNA